MAMAQEPVDCQATVTVNRSELLASSGIWMTSVESAPGASYAKVPPICWS
jgi:hypothetical protein